MQEGWVDLLSFTCNHDSFFWKDFINISPVEQLHGQLLSDATTHKLAAVQFMPV